MAARYFTGTFCTDTVTLVEGMQRDSVTDAALITKIGAGNVQTTVVVAGPTTITGVLSQWLATYPTGNIS